MRWDCIRFTALLLFLCCAIGRVPAVSAAATPELQLEAGVGQTLSGGAVTVWADARGNGRAMRRTSANAAPQIAGGGQVRFTADSTMTYASDYEGAGTLIAVVRVGQILPGSGFLTDGLTLDSVAISCPTLERSEKILGYVPGREWFCVAIRQNVSGTSHKVSFWVDGEKTANALAVSAFLPLQTLGGGDFSLHAVRLYRGALSDAEVAAQSRAMLAQARPATSVVTEQAEFGLSDGQITAAMQLRSQTDTDCMVFGVLRGAAGSLESVAQTRVSLAGDTAVSANLQLPATDGGKTVSVYLWQAGSMRPLSAAIDVAVCDIGYTGPSTSQPPESSQSVPVFAASLPAANSMQLQLNQFDQPAPAFLAAKGYLAQEAYQPELPMDAAAFAQALARMSGVDGPAKTGTLTRIGALEAMDGMLRQCRRAYAYQTALPYTDIGGLSSAQKAAVNTCFLTGIIEGGDTLLPHAVLKQQEAMDYLTRCAVNAELVRIGRGAQQPYTTQYARHADTNGTRVVSIADRNGSYAADNIAFEAEGKECVSLGMGEWIAFDDCPAADRLILRYHIPKKDKQFDSSGNALPVGGTATVGLYINGVRKQSVALDALPLYAAKSDEGYKGLFADVVISQSVQAGDRVEIRADHAQGFPQADDFSDGIGISLLRFEQIPDVRPCPEGFLDVRQFGAYPDDMADDTLAIAAAIDQAYRMGTGVYLPAGRYITGKKLAVPSGVAITGAGMWYTVLDCPYDNVFTRGGRTGFSIAGQGVEISHLKISASQNYRRTGNTASCINGKGENAYLHDIWMERGGTGIWAELYRSRIARCRITDTFADGIHLTGPSQGVEISGCLITGGGDDGIATTGETRGKSVLSDITIRGNTVESAYHGRGIMLSGTAHSVVEDNDVAYIFRNPAILAWTEGTYDTMSVYDITIRRNVCVASRRNPGLHRGAITLFCNRGGHWADGDIYDNETYKNQMIHGYYGADCQDSDGVSRMYLELSNNISHMTHGTGYEPIGSHIQSEDTVMQQKNMLALSF